MPDEPHARWPGRVALAIVRSDPPQAFVAADEYLLGRLLALQLVAATPPERLGGYIDDARDALLEERWADAVVTWMHATGETVDAYPDERLWSDAMLDQESVSMAIRMSRIFDDEAHS